MNPVAVNLDVTDLLTPPQRAGFEQRTGLVRAPATLILPPEAQEDLQATLKESQLVVAFLHGLGAGRQAWGLSEDGGEPEGLAALVLHSLWLKGQKAVGLALAGLGQDGSVLSPAFDNGITPQNYAQQLEETLRCLGLLEGKKVLVIGHSIGGAAAWEFASRISQREKRDPKGVTVVALSPVRALAESRLLTFGCRLSGVVLGIGHLLSSLFHPLMEPASRKIAALAAGLRGLARQGKFLGSLQAVRGMVLVGQNDWVARRGLKESLKRARSAWPVSILPGVGHNLLTLPTLGVILVNCINQLLQG